MHALSMQDQRDNVQLRPQPRAQLRALDGQIDGHGDADKLLHVRRLVLVDLADEEVGDDVRELVHFLEREVVLGEVEEVGRVADRERDADVLVLRGGGYAAVDCLYS